MLHNNYYALDALHSKRLTFLQLHLYYSSEYVARLSQYNYIGTGLVLVFQFMTPAVASV